MLTIRSLTAALLAVGMAASAHAGIVWQGGMDDARRNAGAFITSPQGKVAGLVWSLDPTATGWKLNRQVGMLQQQPFPLQGGYSPLRPASQYGISGPNKAAVIDVPATVKVPGKSTEVPVRILEPLKKSTLAKSIVKALPVLGTAYQVGELLDELGMLFRNGEWLIEQEPDPSQYPVSQGVQWGISNYQVYWAPLPYGFTALGACQYFARNPPYNGTGTVINNNQTCVISYSGFTSYLPMAYRTLSAPCQAGTIWNGSTCVPSIPLIEVPITEQQAAEKIESDASTDRLISIINGFPPDPDVIDVIAREVQDDPEDEMVRWPSQSPLTAPTTYQIGEPLVQTQTNPDGSTVTTTTTTTATTSDDRIDFTTRTEVVTRDATGTPTGTTTVVTTPTSPSNPNSTQQEDLECGLPDTPPCKIDETGTPAPPDPDGESVFNRLLPQCIQSDWKTCFPELPSINWAFQLPSGCSPIPTPAFARYGLPVVDICPYQPVIHDLMSMLWAAAGLFGAIAILSGGANRSES